MVRVNIPPLLPPTVPYPPSPPPPTSCLEYLSIGLYKTPNKTLSWLVLSLKLSFGSKEQTGRFDLENYTKIFGNGTL